MKRRDFLMTAGASVLAPNLMPNTGWAAGYMDLKAAPVMAQILPTGDGPTAMLGFNGDTPGPEIRVRQGEQVAVRFANGIDQGSAVHWHGIRSDNAMDGVPGLTQDVVGPGGNFDYRFTAPDAGTYWYHSHNRSWEQVARGLYGALIVEETTPPDVDHDITVMIDDWRLSETGVQPGGYDDMRDQAHAGRLGNYARALFNAGLTLRQGDRIRVRLINVATARVFPVEITGVQGVVVALDGMPLAQPQQIAEITLAPAQRVDVIVDVTASDKVGFVFPNRNGPYDLGAIPVSGTNPDKRDSPVAPLPSNRVASPDVTAAIPVPLLMQGGAMSRQMMTDGIWSFNGQSGMSDTPLHRFARGETARLTLQNDTRFAHGIHLHGHHFHEMAADGTVGPLRDTSLVAANEQHDILCVFDNPGKWLLHCHMLGHQAAGMKTWVEVA